MKIAYIEWDEQAAVACELLKTNGYVVTIKRAGRHERPEAIFVRLAHRIDAKFLEATGQQLRYVCTATTGTDHIDLAECERRGITVISLAHAPGMDRIPATAELTIGLILALTRRITAAASPTGGATHTSS